VFGFIDARPAMMLVSGTKSRAHPSNTAAPTIPAATAATSEMRCAVSSRPSVSSYQTWVIPYKACTDAPSSLGLRMDCAVGKTTDNNGEGL